MRQVAISEFKARCLALLEDVRATGEPLVVTRRGVPVARIEPPSDVQVAQRRLGGLRHTTRITGDIVAPAVEPEEWEVLR